MRKVKQDTNGLWMFRCLGCGHLHVFNTDPAIMPKVWEFNGDVDKPTVRASLLFWTEDTVCHSFITDGKIQYLPDCTHELAGQTIKLPDYDKED